MITSMIRAALGQRLIVVVLALVLCAFGLREATKLSVDAFPAGKKFTDLMESLGYKECRCIPLSGGIASIYIGVK